MIAILSETSHNFLPVSDLTYPVMAEYCKRHGYTFVPQRIDSPERGIVWDRFLHLQNHLPHVSWAVHMDADVLITNMNIRLEEFTQTTHAEIIISRCLTETGTLRFNDGVAFFKNTPRNIALMGDVFKAPETDFVKCGQDELESLYANGKIPSPEFGRHKSINSFLYTEYGMPETTIGHWTKGDFVLHMPGMTNERRIEIIQEHLPNILK